MLARRVSTRRRPRNPFAANYLSTRNPINKFSHLDKPVGELVSFFQQKPGAWWANKENQLSFLNWFREALGYESLERFYSTPRELLTRMGGTQLLKVHNSLGAAVTDNYPTHYWEKWRFVDRDSNWHHEQNQRRAYFDSVGKTLRFSGLEDWYKYPMDSLKTEVFKELIQHYKSLYQVLRLTYPDHKWEPWRFTNHRVRWWTDANDLRRYLQWLMEQRGKDPSRLENYYSLKQSDILSPFPIRDTYETIQDVLVKAFPGHNWLAWKFASSLPRNWWKERSNQMAYMTWLKQELNYTHFEDMYKLNTSILIKYRGRGLLEEYNLSVLSMLQSLYPQHEWLDWRFTSVGYWSNPENRMKYLTWLSKQLNINKMDDWYKIGVEEFEKNQGIGVLRPFGGSPSLCLMCSFPLHHWKPWLFSAVPKHFWDSDEQVLLFLEDFAYQRGLKCAEDWYSVTLNDIINNKGSGLLERFGSFIGIMKFAFPNHEWEVWKFSKPPPGFWDSAQQKQDLEVLSSLLKQIASKLNVVTLEDWYRVSKTAMGITAFSRLRKFGGLKTALALVYPEHEWDPSRFGSQQKKKTLQRNLKHSTAQLFPRNTSVVEDHRIGMDTSE